MRGRSRQAKRDRFGREPYLRVCRRPQRRGQLALRRGPARSRVHGQQWFGRRHADRRSKFDECVAAMRHRRPIPKSRTKKPAADCSARVNQTRFDDGILPVFCPTCQTNLRARRELADQEDRPMTLKTTSRETSRNLRGVKLRIDEPRIDKARNAQKPIIEDARQRRDRAASCAAMAAPSTFPRNPAIF
ncbi:MULTISPECIES: hypothetical protein [Bradyrhizobium]|uniref:hypothetical protein n=1 Tax=Bradyrhizobium TaxID=374 RepID=UPI001FCADC87|nr:MULTISPECIES: hypothetical protein [unclassified Bradyrhizobium]